MNPLDDFINQIISEANIANLDSDFEQAYREKMRLALARRIGTEALNLLDEQGFTDFTALMASQGDTPDPNVALQFFQERVPEFEIKVKDILASFKQDYLNAAQAVK